MTDPLTSRLGDLHERYRQANPRSDALHRRAAAVLPGGSTRSVLDMEPFPFKVASARGARLVDVDGHDYLDLLGDYTAGLLGHDPAPVAEAVIARLANGWGLGATHPDEARLAELICDRFGSIEQVRFTNSGTEANLMAIQLARHHTGRAGILAFDGAYHGGLLYFGPGGEALRVPFPVHLAPYDDLDEVARLLDEHGHDVAVVLVEPMMGAAGCIRPSEGFLPGLRQLCDHHDVLLVFDEVMTSRLSVGGAQERLGVQPDLTTLGKYLAGGMTFGAFGGRAELMAAFDPARAGTIAHGGTFNNNAVSMAAGVAALDQVLTAEAIEAVFERGERLRSRAVTALQTAPHPWTVTGWGSMLSIHPVAAPVRRPADLRRADPRRRAVLHHELLHRGIYIAPRGLIALSLAVTEDDLDQFLGILEDLAPTL